VPLQHVVKEGDHLAAIADRNGFAEVKPILDDPQNKALAARRHPCILEPGETLVVPDPRPKEASLPTERIHKIEVRRLKTVLRLKLADVLGAALQVAHAGVSLDGGKPADVAMGKDGKVNLPIPIHTQKVELTAELDGEDAPALRWTCRVGYLRRAEHKPGAFARLENLGYYRPDVPSEREPHERSSAIEEFQLEHSLKVNGKLDAATVDKLIEVHGS
jgi:hypothetical protein